MRYDVEGRRREKGRFLLLGRDLEGFRDDDAM